MAKVKTTRWVTGALLAASIGIGAWPAVADGPTMVAEPLGHATFTDDVSAQLRVKLDGKATHVVNVDDASAIRTMRMTLDEGFQIGWHSHPGPVLITVVRGEFTYVSADDCIERVYRTGEALVDLGQGNVHRAEAGEGGAVLIATFLGLDEHGPTQPHQGPAPCSTS